MFYNCFTSTPKYLGDTVRTTIRELLASLNQELEYYEKQVQKNKKFLVEIQQQIITLEDMVENREFERDRI